jgi:hypothetical protein
VQRSKDIKQLDLIGNDIGLLFFEDNVILTTRVPHNKILRSNNPSKNMSDAAML